MSHDDGVYTCADPSCSVCWLYAPRTAEWEARVRAEWSEAPTIANAVNVRRTATTMTRVKTRRLKDGRIPGVLTRRLLDAMVKRPGRVVAPEDLRASVWPDGAPKHWRIRLAQQARWINECLDAQVIVRVGNQARLVGFRLDAKLLPAGDLTQRRSTRPKRWDWSPAEDAVIRAHARDLPLSELTDRVNAVHGRARRHKGVEGRIYRLGLSKKGAPRYSANSLAPILGVSGEKITRWIEREMLAARRHEPTRQAVFRHRWGWWVIEHADVETFIRAHPWEVDWRAMRAGHPLTLLAQSLQRRDPYLTLSEAARQAGVSQSVMLRRLHDGSIPGARRVTPHAPRSSPELATWRIPLSALDAIGAGAL